MVFQYSVSRTFTQFQQGSGSTKRASTSSIRAFSSSARGVVAPLRLSSRIASVLIEQSVVAIRGSL